MPHDIYDPDYVKGIFDSHGYSMIGEYVVKFGNCSEFQRHLQDCGLHTMLTRYFFGCATGVSGHRPREPA